MELENEEDKEVSLFKRKRNDRADVSGHICSLKQTNQSSIAESLCHSASLLSCGM